MSLYGDLWNRNTSHRVSSVTPNDRNIELRVILIDKLRNIDLPKGEVIYQFLVSDHTGSIVCNFYGDFGRNLKCGDIVYLSSLYAQLYKERRLIICTSKRSSVYKIGEFFLSFEEEPKMSETLWEKETNGLFYRVA